MGAHSKLLPLYHYVYNEVKDCSFSYSVENLYRSKYSKERFLVRGVWVPLNVRFPKQF